MSNKQIQQHINKYRKKQKVSLLELAQHTHFTMSEIQKIDRCDKWVTIKQLKEMYDAINAVVLKRVRIKNELEKFNTWVNHLGKRRTI